MPTARISKTAIDPASEQFQILADKLGGDKEATAAVQEYFAYHRRKMRAEVDEILTWLARRNPELVSR